VSRERIQISEHLYPFTPQTLSVDGYTISYVDEGARDGEITVMVHGNPTWSFYYRHLIEAVVDAGGRALAIDHIGCGLSDKPSERDYPYTLSRRVDDLTAWIEQLNLGETPFNLVVHDWGGMIGCAYAIRHPERLKRLIVLNTAAFHLPRDKRLPFTLWLGRNTWVGKALIRGMNAFSGLATRWACMRPLSREVRQAYTAPYNTWANRVATHEFVRDIPLSPDDSAYATVSETQEGLERLKDKPILIGWGMRDFVFDEPFLREWRRRFPEAEVHRFEEGGHYILEDHRDELIPLITRFLSSPVT
jgi:cis-3-alkyl-4-acyloxetan-2-one decarboxylase